MKLFFATLSVAVLAASSVFAEVKIEAPKGTYASDSTHTSVTWKVDHMGLSKYTARFTDAKANLTFDPANVEASTVKVTINPNSVRTDYPASDKKDFDKILATDAKYFNSTQFPAIVFNSTKVTKTGDNTGTMVGDLNLLGVTKPVTFDVTYNGSLKEHPYANKVGALGFSATTTIKRSDFGMDYLIPNVGDEVDVLVEVEFLEQKAEKQ